MKKLCFISTHKSFHSLLCSNFLEVTTIEGIIDRSVCGLEQDQEARRRDHPEAAAQIDAFVAKLKKLKDVETPFQMVSIVSM